MNCIVTSPNKTTSYREAQSVTIPAFSGEMQVLPGHAEAFVLLNQGNIVIERTGGQKDVVEITEGECYVRDDDMVVIL